jgi:HSP20 family protein
MLSPKNTGDFLNIGHGVAWAYGELAGIDFYFCSAITNMGIIMAKKNERGRKTGLVPGRLSESEPFESGFSRFFNAPMLHWDWNAFNQFPSIDMSEEGDKIKVKADIPGVDKDKVKVHVYRNSISIKAETGTEKEEKGRNFYYKERSASGYYRSIPLPVEVNADTAKAKVENGTLEIVVTKKDGTKQEHREVKVE